ncbi:MAG: hypothetical protein WDO68_32450 [Gammaproteobacteria bacterium]
MDDRAKLLTKIFDQGFRTPDSRHDQPPPVVTLEDFFEGNTQPDSIAVNLAEHPGVEFFYERLKAIRSRPDVQAVLVNIYDLSPIIFDPDHGWPYAENVHILTSAPESTVQEWAAELLSDGAGEGWPYGQPSVALEAKGSSRWWFLAWD